MNIIYLFIFLSAQEQVAAEVNGKVISVKELEQRYNEDRAFVSNKEVTKAKVLNDLINRELGIERAKREKLMDHPVVKAKMEDVLFHAQITKDLEDAFKKIDVSEADVRRYYNNYPEIRTAHILFRLRANPSKVEQEEALKMAINVYKTLQDGPDNFPSLANKYSQAVNAVNGGDLGFVPAVRLAPEYFKAIKDKPAGHITSPVRTQFGYHIIKVMAKKPFKEIDIPSYKKIVYDIKKEQLIENYFKDLRNNASIKINKKALDI